MEIFSLRDWIFVKTKKKIVLEICLYRQISQNNLFLTISNMVKKNLFRLFDQLTTKIIFQMFDYLFILFGDYFILIIDKI